MVYPQGIVKTIILIMGLRRLRFKGVYRGYIRVSRGYLVFRV